jgi:hypothetical protein
VNSKLIFIGYDLTLSALENQSLVSGEVKNANYLMQSLNEIGVDILPLRKVYLGGIERLRS